MIALNLVTLLLYIVTVAVAFIRYLEEKRKERLLRDVELRRDFFASEALSRIQGLIEARDQKLEALLKELTKKPVSASSTPKPPDRLNPEGLWQWLDNYVNALEAVASLLTRGWLDDKDFSGYWKYYLKRLHDWLPLRKYVSTEYYEWNDVRSVWCRWELCGECCSTDGHKHG